MIFSWQQILALLVILFFITRLGKQRRKKQISGSEFALWLGFWLLSALAIIFLKQLDKWAASLGFSASGINLLFYVATLFLFYLVFKLRLHLARLDKDLTILARQQALEDAKKPEDMSL